MASSLFFPALLLFTSLLVASLSARRIEILTTTKPGRQAVSEPDCSSPADVIFILDGSTSIVPDDFMKQVAFVRSFIQDMDVSPDKVRVGVTTFATELHTFFNLNTFKTKEEIIKSVSEITHPMGRTHTWLVLEYLRQEAFTVDNGARYGVPKIAIILTDGGSNDKPKTMADAKLLHQDPIRVYAIGVGGYVDKEELSAVASKPENIYLVQDFNALQSIEDTVRENICKKVCGLNPVDIIFMLDESTSIWEDDYAKQVDFLVSFIKDAVIGTKHTQIGVVTFSTNVYNRFYLNQHHKRRALIDAVKEIERNHGDTYTDRALRFIAAQGFTTEHGGREGVPHIVIVITDGQSTMPVQTKRAAEEIRKSEAIVFAIGVGSGIDPAELGTIAGEQSRVYQVISYDALKNIESVLFDNVCKIEKKDEGEK